MQPIGVGRRAVAVIIDTILLMIVGYAIAAMTGQFTPTGFDLRGGPAFLLFGIGLAYYVAMEGTRGQTLGKMAMGIKVVKKDGSKADWGAVIIRNLLRLVDGFFFYLVGAIVVWVTKSRQRVGDIAANTIVVSAKAALVMAVALAIGVAAPREGLAAAPHYTDLVLSDADGGAAKSAFKPDTAKIYLNSKLADMPAGTRLKANWIAEKTKVAPPNYKIDSVDLKVGPGMNQARFSLSKPNAGWPEGDYRVDLLIDDKPATQVRFRVAK